MKNFVSPHTHPQSLDSGSTIERMIKKEVELGTGYATITDHGTLEACLTHYDLCHKHGIKPILGLEAYFRDDECPILEKHGMLLPDEKGKVGASEYLKYYHLTMHFLDQEAYMTAVRIISEASLNHKEVHFGQTKPLFTWKDLEELGKKNVIFCSGCLVGMVQRHLMVDKPGIAMDYYKKLRSLAKPGNFYVEVFPHRCTHDWVNKIFVHLEDGEILKLHPKKTISIDDKSIRTEDFEKQFNRRKNYTPKFNGIFHYRVLKGVDPKTVVKVERHKKFFQNECSDLTPDGDLQYKGNIFVLNMARNHGDPVIISDDAHFANSEEKLVQNARLGNGKEDWKFHGSYHRRTTADTIEYFTERLNIDLKTIEGWVENSYKWAKRFDNFNLEFETRLPVKFYPGDPKQRIAQLIIKHGRFDPNNKVMVEQLKKEMSILSDNKLMNLIPYFFPLEEVVDLYQSKGLLTGPGRGSAAGFLLSYLIGITHVDPIKYGLSTERFITQDRINAGTLPDIDQDLEDRELLVGKDGKSGWLKERFGEEFVAQISTDHNLRLKSSIKDVHRSFGRITPDIESICKRLPAAPQGTNDYDFIHGKLDKDGNVIDGMEGLINKQNPEKTNPALKEYIETYPEEWKIVENMIGVPRQKSRHACLPKGELIHTKANGLIDIVNCNGLYVYTGQGKRKRGQFSSNGKAILIPQGKREIIEYTLDTGKKIKCTSDHLVLTNLGWVTIQEAFEKGYELQKARNRIKLLEKHAVQYAQKRNGKLLDWGGKSTVKSSWQCSEGHRWKAPFNRIFNYEYWCRECSHKYRFRPNKTSQSIERLAGKCLSTYKRYDKKREWICDLLLEDVIEAKQSICIYCERQATGFERLDNNLGHIKTNCVPACLRCNWMRGHYVSHEVMLQVGKLLKKIDP